MNNHRMYRNCSHTYVIQQDQRGTEQGVGPRTGNVGQATSLCSKEETAHYDDLAKRIESRIKLKTSIV